MPKRRKVVMARQNPHWKAKKQLLQAVVDEDIPLVVKLCEEGVPPDKRAVHAAPFPIEVAVALGNYGMAEALLAHGAYPAAGTAEQLGLLSDKEKKAMYDDYCELGEFDCTLTQMVLSRAKHGQPAGRDMPKNFAYVSFLVNEMAESRWLWDDELRWYRLFESYNCLQCESVVREVSTVNIAGGRGDQAVLAHRARRVHFYLSKIPKPAVHIRSIFKRAFQNLDFSMLNMLLVHGFHYPVDAYRSYGFEFVHAAHTARDSDGLVLRVRDQTTVEDSKTMASWRYVLFSHALRSSIDEEATASTDPPTNLDIPLVWADAPDYLDINIIVGLNHEEAKRRIRICHDRAFLLYERVCKNKMSGPWGRYKQRFWMKSLTTFWWLKVSKLSIPPEKGGSMDMAADLQSSTEGIAAAYPHYTGA